MKTCCCCGAPLLRHIRWHKNPFQSRIYWYCMHCHQEMPICEVSPERRDRCASCPKRETQPCPSELSIKP